MFCYDVEYIVGTANTSLSTRLTLALPIQREIQLFDDLYIEQGDSGLPVRRVQEWLNLRGCGLDIDSAYGPNTQEVVALFQASKGLEETGEVDQVTMDALSRPMIDVLCKSPNSIESFSEMLLHYANIHCGAFPREVGGQNCGPWVRMYMDGNQGAAWPWCAGFVTFLMNQAAETLNMALPIDGSFSCDVLAANAAAEGLLISGDSVELEPDLLIPGSLFLVRRTANDWTHIGVVAEANDEYFRTIEGNTNDEGSREGYEVCKRTRGYGNKDFIIWKD